MAAIVTSIALEMELAGVGGGWTNVGTGATNYLVVPQGGYAITIKRGVDPATRQMYVATCDFVLDNSSEVFTPGNTASAYYNRIVKGIGVRFSTTVGAVIRYWFTGTLAGPQPSFPDYGPGANYVAIHAVGLAQQLADAKTYSMAVQPNVDVDDAATAIMVAMALGSTRYSFPDSTTVLPYVFPRSDPLSDLVALYASEPGSLLYEDGQGRMVGIPVESMTGSYASPTHTWGSTISPVGDVVPDYRNEAVFARQEVQLTVPTISEDQVTLYRHPFNFENGLCERMISGSNRILSGTFDQPPLSAADVATKFSSIVQVYQLTPAALAVNINASVTGFYTSDPDSNPTRFQVGDRIEIDSEHMEVTAASTNVGTHSQSLTVTRGTDGTVAVAHIAGTGPVPRPIYLRPKQRQVGNFAGQVGPTPLGTGTTTFTVNSAAAFTVGWTVLINLEEMLVTATDTFANTITVVRAQNGTAAAAHAAAAQIQRVIYTYVDAPPALSSYVIASLFPDGTPPEGTGSGIIGTGQFAGGADIQVTGNTFLAGIHNAMGQDGYLADLAILGKATTVRGTNITFAYAVAVNGLVGLPDGPSISIPYGVNSIETAKGAAMSALMAGRLQSPWLTLTFLVDSATTATDLIAGTTGVEIGHLVRYTGLGTNREKVDEWYRVMGISMDVPDVVSGTADLEPIRMTFVLAPAHTIRDARKVAYSDFTIQAALSGGAYFGVGYLNILPSGVNDWATSGAAANWRQVNSVSPARVYKVSGLDQRQVVNVGSGDQEVRVAAAGMSGAQNSYPGAPNGVGAVFRSDATGANCWQCFFLPFAGGFVFLWNTTDGTVTSVAWTKVDGDSLIVRAQGTRIRVYASDQPEPIIDITSTRFQTQTYVGFNEKHTIVSASTTPYITSFYGQGL